MILNAFLEFPQISTKAMKVLIPFTSTYLCECGFPALTQIKNRYRSRLQVEDDLRLFLSAVQPRIKSEASMFSQIWTIN